MSESIADLGLSPHFEFDYELSDERLVRVYVWGSCHELPEGFEVELTDYQVFIVESPEDLNSPQYAVPVKLLDPDDQEELEEECLVRLQAISWQ